MTYKIYSLQVNCMILGILSLSLISCNKYLDEKPLKSLATPNSIEDLQALLEDNSIMNGQYPILSINCR